MTTRPDPRAFPSETGWLLALLAAAVLPNAWFVAGWLADPGGTGNAGGPTAWEQLVMLLSPGPATYVLYARWRVRRGRPLEGTRWAGAARTVTAMAQRLGVTAKVQVRLGPALGARAFVAGQSARPCLLLGPELLALHELGLDQRRVFDAVVRHELAHLRGGDLWWYQVATALRVTNVFSAAWLVFGVGLSLSVGDASTGQLVVTLLRGVGLVLLAEAIARVFLRVREHHADLDAAADGGVSGLLAALDGGRERSALLSWLRHHPGARQRRTALTGPGLLLAPPAGQVLLGATTAGALLITAEDQVLASGPTDPTRSTIAVGLVVGIPLTVFVALTVWRAVWHAAPAGGRRDVLGCAAALFAGLVLGSHLSPYTRVSGFGATGIPLAPSVLLAFAAGALGLCLWLAALASARVPADPAATRLGPFLAGAGLAAVVVGGWLFAVLWTWAARLLGVRLGCTADQEGSAALCRLEHPEAAVARSVGTDLLRTPYTVAVLVLLVAALALAARRARQPAALAAAVLVTAAAATVAFWQVGKVAVAPVRLDVRPVLQAEPNTAGAGAAPATDAEGARRTRQSSDPDTQRAMLDSFTCPDDDPLHGDADRAVALVTCSADGTEKYLLGPAEMGNADLARAEAGQSGVPPRPALTLTFADPARWEALTTRYTGQQVAFLLDDAVVIAPQVTERLTDGVAVVSGGLTLADARQLAAGLNGR